VVHSPGKVCDLLASVVLVFGLQPGDQCTDGVALLLCEEYFVSDEDLSCYFWGIELECLDHFRCPVARDERGDAIVPIPFDGMLEVLSDSDGDEAVILDESKSCIEDSLEEITYFFEWVHGGDWFGELFDSEFDFAIHEFHESELGHLGAGDVQLAIAVDVRNFGTDCDAALELVDIVGLVDEDEVTVWHVEDVHVQAVFVRDSRLSGVVTFGDAGDALGVFSPGKFEGDTFKKDAFILIQNKKTSDDLVAGVVSAYDFDVSGWIHGQATNR
jgi:hypothetical protein